MLQISVARLYEDNRDRLGLAWLGGRSGQDRLIRRDLDTPAFVGHLNLIHPNRVQVLGANEAAYLRKLDPDTLPAALGSLFAAQTAAVLCAEGMEVDHALLAAGNAAGVPVLSSPNTSAEVIERLRRYLAKILADSTQLHGVCMDVLGLGVLITGDSGVGKSELALELISRGHGLVADDAVEISRIAATTLECRCPPLLKDYLEVRGLGILNIRTIFGETAVRLKMNLRLIVNLEGHAGSRTSPAERLPLHELSEDILGVAVRKVVIPVAAGRNLAVLLESAVRDYILQLRGINSTEEFITRQRAELRGGGN